MRALDGAEVSRSDSPDGRATPGEDAPVAADERDARRRDRATTQAPPAGVDQGAKSFCRMLQGIIAGFCIGFQHSATIPVRDAVSIGFSAH